MLEHRLDQKSNLKSGTRPNLNVASSEICISDEAYRECALTMGQLPLQLISTELVSMYDIVF